MHNNIDVHLWGATVCLDEENTKALLTALDAGSGISAVLAAIFPDLRGKVAFALGVAMLKLGGTLIKSVDEQGGAQGVCISFFWAGPVPGWVRAQTA
jgi:hypothetical protein